MSGASDDTACKAGAELQVEPRIDSLTRFAEAVRQLGIAATLATFAKGSFVPATGELVSAPLLKAT